MSFIHLDILCWIENVSTLHVGSLFASENVDWYGENAFLRVEISTLSADVSVQGIHFMNGSMLSVNANRSSTVSIVDCSFWGSKNNRSLSIFGDGNINISSSLFKGNKRNGALLVDSKSQIPFLICFYRTIKYLSVIET